MSQTIPSFQTTTLEVDLSRSAIRFGYRITTIAGATHNFTERVFFVSDLIKHEPAQSPGFLSSLPLVHALLGVSYFKTNVPPVVDLRSCRLLDAELAVVRLAYTEGLGEFAYANRLERVFETEFLSSPIDVEAASPQAFRKEPGDAIVMFGGGKDSLVSVEALRQRASEPWAFVVNRTPAIARALTSAGIPVIIAKRRLDPQLLDPEIAQFTGHVPITCLNAALAVAAAHLVGRSDVVMSNEASASEPDLHWNGRDVNHQWSKSLNAERLLGSAVSERSNGRIRCFSLLRQLNETQIVGIFSIMPQYHASFMSCNRTLRSPANAIKWCQDCDKCRFIFLALVLFIGRDQAARVLGADLLADAEQVDKFGLLLASSGTSPLDCVGTTDECAAIVLALGRTDRNASTLRKLCKIGLERAPRADLQAVLTYTGTTTAPEDYRPQIEWLQSAVPRPIVI